MPYQDYADGVYLASQPSTKGGLAHFAALDIGNCLQISGADGITPVLVHQCPPRICADWFYGTGTWQLLAVETNALAARQRYMAALTVPDYDVLRHNCEHFSRFVVTGSWESKQLQAIGWLAGVAALIIVAANNDPLPRRPRAQPAGDRGYARRRRRGAAQVRRAQW